MCIAFGNMRHVIAQISCYSTCGCLQCLDNLQTHAEHILVPKLRFGAWLCESFLMVQVLSFDISSILAVISTIAIPVHGWIKVK